MKGRCWATKHISRVLDRELAAALKRCPDDPDLLALKGSRGDTLSDTEILHYLEDWNATGKVLHDRQ